MIEVGDVVVFHTTSREDLDGLVIGIEGGVFIIETDCYGSSAEFMRGVFPRDKYIFCDNKRYISRREYELELVKGLKHAKIKTEFLQGIEL